MPKNGTTSDNFDVNDFAGGRRNPRRYMRGLSKAIRKGERGYHAALRARTAGLLAMVYAACDDYDLFCDWRQTDCFEDNAKLLSLTEDDYQPHVPRCVVTLACSGSDILASTRSKTLTVVKALAEAGVKPEDCEKVIKAKGGFEGAYQEAKEERACRKDPGNTPGSAKSKKARNKASKPTGKAKERREASTVRGEGDDPHATQLWINLQEEDLEDFCDNSEDGEIRLLKVLRGGKKGPTSPTVWSLLEYKTLEDNASEDDSE